MRSVLYIIFTFLNLSAVHAQVNLRGNVYRDSLSKKPIDSVLVYIKSGAYFFTDKQGGYQIAVSGGDTLWVYNHGKTHSFYMSRAMLASKIFDIYLNDTTEDKIAFHQLAPVFVRNSNYTKDSINNRKEYADIFNYKKARVGLGNNKWRDSTNGIALNTQDKKLSLLDISGLWQATSKENKEKLRLQKRLVETEHSNYVDQHFNPTLVEKYTAMHDDDSLHMFVKRFAPPYEELITMNELDIAEFIVKQIAVFRTK
jgi:hypothetical protein